MLLKNGSTGNYVMYLQYGLHIMCCPPGSFDSKFGSGTENAVKKYQGKKGLTQDGIIGDGTWNALVSDIKTIQQLLKNKVITPVRWMALQAQALITLLSVFRKHPA